MKIPYKHLIKNINPKPDVNELSQKLFQLGHEHEIVDEIFDIDITPNRGDCLSLDGLLRDLKLFYDFDIENNIYEKNIDPFPFKFINNAEKFCTNISFLNVEVDEVPSNYSGSLENYFQDLNIKKNNFFTDISNFISYETGQPTHCYDANKIDQPIRLDFNKKKCQFETLLDKTIEIKEDNLVFYNKHNEVINLAGIVGGKDTACNKQTKSVLIECAYFDPEAIIGKSVEYGINSEAAHKFERNTDPNCHSYVLRRFLKIIDNHTNIKKVDLFSNTYFEREVNSVPFQIPKINKVLGTKIDDNKCIEYLSKLGFIINEDNIIIPSFRNDINSINDIAEEIARAIGYDNIESQKFAITLNEDLNINFEESKFKQILIDSGFYEVINDPFVSKRTKKSIVVDNPLDSNRTFLRTDLKDSLVRNLLYNERRQKDSIKLFEIADIYDSKSDSSKRIAGIIASGRVDKNYQDFSKKIENKFIVNILRDHLNNKEIDFIDIPRESLDSKSKNHISYLEIDIDDSFLIGDKSFNRNRLNKRDIQYIPISDFPCSTRDLSFSIKDYSRCKILEDSILSLNHSLLKEVFIFDYFKNEKLKEIKIGFRFVFQSHDGTITDSEVNEVMDSIITNALNIDTVSIPGLA
ncbi:MAG: hypothetical protein CMF96_08275 [Candidatus Marinimicrobia bacterium]|nr:hypothetical protein [Candidatus Neomarinimicrobiota bacterium]